MMKMAQGQYEVSHSRDNICFVTWNNNGVVTTASNSHWMYPVQQFSLWDQKEK